MDKNRVKFSRGNQRQAFGRAKILPRFNRIGLTVLLAVLFVIALIYISYGLFGPAPKGQEKTASQLSDTERERQIGADAPSVVDSTPADRYGIPSKSPSDPRMSFVLLGYGGAGHDGAYLTDSIMVAIADPVQKTLALLSVPRDCWVPMMFDGKTAFYNKLNTAFAFAKDTSLYPNRLERYTGDHGAGNFTADTAARPLGIPISNYFALDFQGFRQMIDAVQGIDVVVPDSFTARYPANDDADIDPSWTEVHFAKGNAHMTGERAIQFARAREVIDNPSESNDFARSRRQRMIMEAFKTRLFQPGGLIHLPQILAISARHVDSDYPLTEAAQISQFLLGWKDVQIYQTALTAANYLTEGTGPNGTYLLVPNTPNHSWAQIRAFARHLWQDPATGVAMANTQVIVVNNTGESGLATQLSAVLTQLGYRVGPPVSGQEQAESHLADWTGGQANALAVQLEKDLGVQLPLTSEATKGNGDELVLYLGANDRSLADLEVPADDAAPFSMAGVVDASGWSSEAAAPTTDRLAPASPTQPRTPRPLGSPAGVASPTSMLKGTPTRTAIASPILMRSPTPEPTVTATRAATTNPPTAIPSTAVPPTPVPSVPTKTPLPTPRPGAPGSP